MVLLRLLWHPHFLLDDETTFVNTVGRDWALGAPGAPTRLQLITYQGSFLLDAWLSSWGYRVFGDHLLAWFWVPAAYVAAFVALGGELSRRVGGRWGLWLWAGLVAGSPFLLKDGLISMPGGHSSSIVWALGSLVALERAFAGSTRAAFWAGVLAGFAAWYTRSAVLVAALLPFVLLISCRRRALARAGVGLLLLPALLVLNGIALSVAGPWAGNEAPADLWSRLLWNVYGLDGHEPSLWGKTIEVIGIASWHQLFAQPAALPGEAIPVGWIWPGAIWAAAFLGVGVTAVLLLAARARRLREFDIVDSVALLVLLYATAYVISPLRIEPQTLDYAWAPLPTMVRYLTPAMLMMVVFLGVGLARLAQGRGRRRWTALMLATVLAVPGIALTLGDRSDRFSDLWESRAPYRYYRVFGAHRGLSRDLLASWEVADGAANRNRLHALGSFAACSPGCVEADLSQPAREVERVVRELGLGVATRAAFARGLGQAFADHLWSSDDFSGPRLLELALGASETMTDADAIGWLSGFGEVAAESPDLLGVAPTELVATLCRVERGGSRPLCQAAGRALAFDCETSGPITLGAGDVPDSALANAAGFRHGRDLPPWMHAACERRLEVELRHAYAEGWRRGAENWWLGGGP